MLWFATSMVVSHETLTVSPACASIYWYLGDTYVPTTEQKCANQRIRNTEKAKKVADDIVANGGIAIPFAGDVQSQSYNDALVKVASDLGGDGKIHHLVTNVCLP